MPDPIYKMQIPHFLFSGAKRPYTEEMMRDPVKKGFYLATIGRCMECHTPMGARGREHRDKLGAGGFEFTGRGSIDRAEHYAQQDQGHRRLDHAEIKTAITQGKRKDGSPLKPPISYPLDAKMTDGDLNAVFAYMRTVPAKE